MKNPDLIALLTGLWFLRSRVSNKELAGLLSTNGLNISPSELSGFATGSRTLSEDKILPLTTRVNETLHERHGFSLSNIPPRARYDPRVIRGRANYGLSPIQIGGEVLKFEDERAISGIWRTFYFPDIETQDFQKLDDILATSNLLFARGFQHTPVARVLLFHDPLEWEGLLSYQKTGSKSSFIIHWQSKAEDRKGSTSAVGLCTLHTLNSSKNQYVITGLANFFPDPLAGMPGGYFFCAQKIGAAGEALISDLKRINHRYRPGTGCSSGRPVARRRQP